MYGTTDVTAGPHWCVYVVLSAQNSLRKLCVAGSTTATGAATAFGVAFLHISLVGVLLSVS